MREMSAISTGIKFTAGVVILLLLAEVSWRMFGPSYADEALRAERAETALRYLRPCAVSVREGEERWLVGARPEYTGGDFKLVPQPREGVLRLAVVGESTGAMLGGALYEIATQQLPGKVEVMNCADSGSSLEHVERRASEVLEYEPDVLVVSFGHNLMIQYPTNELALRVGFFLRKSRLMAGLSRHFASTPRPLVQTVQLERFETWLRQLAVATRRRGVDLVVTTMAANLWFAPAVSADVLFDDSFLAARMEYARGDVSNAIDTLDTLLATRSEPYWHFTIGTWLAERGDLEAAAAHLRAAIDTDALEADRRPSAVNEVIRRVAREEKLLLRDTDKEIEAIARPGLPGWAMFSDHCHLQPAYLRQEAAAILRMTVNESLSPAPVDSSVSMPQPCIERSLNGLVGVLATRHGFSAQRFLRSITSLIDFWLRKDPQAVEREVGRLTKGSFFLGVKPSERRGEVVASIAEGYWLAGRKTDAAALNRRARLEGGAAPWVELGLFRLGRGDESSAQDAFKRALEIAPRPDAAFYLAHLEGRR